MCFYSFFSIIICLTFIIGKKVLPHWETSTLCCRCCAKEVSLLMCERSFVVVRRRFRRCYVKEMRPFTNSCWTLAVVVAVVRRMCCRYCAKEAWPFTATAEWRSCWCCCAKELSLLLLITRLMHASLLFLNCLTPLTWLASLPFFVGWSPTRESWPQIDLDPVLPLYASSMSVSVIKRVMKLVIYKRKGG